MRVLHSAPQFTIHLCASDRWALGSVMFVVLQIFTVQSCLVLSGLMWSPLQSSPLREGGMRCDISAGGDKYDQIFSPHRDLSSPQPGGPGAFNSLIVVVTRTFTFIFDIYGLLIY